MSTETRGGCAGDSLTATSGPMAENEILDLTDLVLRAKSGTRSDVRALADALDLGELHVPLAKSIEGAPIGNRIEFPDELSLTPHLLAEDEGGLYCALFTNPEILGTLEDRLGWQTDDSTLEYCTLPARVAIDMALQVINEVEVVGLVFNALDDTELVLDRRELAALAQGAPIPLVGYVQHIPGDDEEGTLIAEPEGPPPPELVTALERIVAEIAEVSSYKLATTFHPERDVEPHLTLRLRTLGDSINHAALASRITAELEGKLPPPGYVDIVFEAEAN